MSRSKTATDSSPLATTPKGTEHVPNGINAVVVMGELYAAPQWRELASGAVTASFSLLVRSDGPTTSVPIVWFDPPKRITTWQPGDRIAVSGSVARRFFRSQGRTVSITEVNVKTAELERHRGRLKRLVASLSEPAELFS